MKAAELKAQAKANLKNRFGVNLLGSVLATGLVALANKLPLVGGMLIYGPLNVGETYIYHRTSEDETPEIRDLFRFFKVNVGEAFLLGVLKMVFLFFWTLLFIIPGIVKGYSYALAEYLMATGRETNALAAITESRRLMNGHKFELFLLGLSFFGWFCLCIITLGIAAFYVGPYYKETKTVFFKRIVESEEA